jgi:hypothetical protein
LIEALSRKRAHMSLSQL